MVRREHGSTCRDATRAYSHRDRRGPPTARSEFDRHAPFRRRNSRHLGSGRDTLHRRSLSYHGATVRTVARSTFFDRYVVATVLLQLVGYAALSAIVPHSDFAAVVAPLQRVPTILLVPVAVLAIPAVVLAIALGVILSIVGVRPTTVLVLISAYIVSVVGLWAYRRVNERRSDSLSA